MVISLKYYLPASLTETNETKANPKTSGSPQSGHATTIMEGKMSFAHLLI